MTPGTLTEFIQASCNCGAVAFEIDAQLSGVYVCHCSICRRSTGSSGIAVVIVDNDAFRWTRGEDKIATWRKQGTDWQTWFCSVCGSRLPGKNDDSRMFVPAGLLADSGSDLKVIHHIYVDSKAGWDEIGDAGKQHREEFRA
ncbi:MAG: GFA family protein [Woeseiaceae bacterium]|nr:GFA family protein [Woeseiaceae bacterium]